MTTKTPTPSGGIDFTGLLAIAFIVLKLTGHITWPWVWVLAPIWIPLALVLAVLLIAGIAIGLSKALDR